MTPATQITSPLSARSGSGRANSIVVDDDEEDNCDVDDFDSYDVDDDEDGDFFL